MNRYCLLIPMLFIILVGGLATGAEEEQKRDPFWPIGYRPAAPVDATSDSVAPAIGQPQWEWPDIPVQGRSRGDDGRYYVLIGGIGVVSAGEEIALQQGEYWFHWRIEEIDESGMRSVRLGVRTEPPAMALIPRGTGR
jgi:hypothetical protein